jgi:Asp-tRNA(Asn)/Glu-tRNA(Gln) amidotransferase A subunit family amidase
MVPVAIGTQVGGSVIRPASFCGNFAIKPTFGALNRGERLGYSQSHLGVHAGSLADLWHVAIEIARRAGGDPGYPGLYGLPDLPAAARPERLIVMETEGWAKLNADSRRAFEQVLSALRGRGVSILGRKDDPRIAAFEQAIARAKALTRDICAFEMRWVLTNLQEQYPGKLSRALTGQWQHGCGMSVEDYRACLVEREEARQRFAGLAPLADALISLSSAGPAPAQVEAADSDAAVSRPTGDSAFNVATSVLGAPTVSIPMMAVDGLPVGVQVVAQAHTDARAVAIARWVSESVPPAIVNSGSQPRAAREGVRA